MKVTYSWIIHSCLIFGTGIFCDKKVEGQQAETSCSIIKNTDDKFNCLNGQSIDWSLLCDDHKDCSDDSDETQELCAPFDSSVTKDCGKVIKDGIGMLGDGYQTHLVNEKWIVGVYRNIPELKFLSFGSIISPNLVITASKRLQFYGLKSKQTSFNDGQYKVGVLPFYLNDLRGFKINVTMIYMTGDYNRNTGFKPADISVLVLESKLSFNHGFIPVCIDWYGKYNVRNKTPLQLIGRKKIPNNQLVIINRKQGHFPYFDNITCQKKFDTYNYSNLITYDKICIKLKERDIDYRIVGAGVSFVHSNTYFLTGVVPYQVFNLNGGIINDTLLGITDIKYYVPWIRGILIKHVTVNSCVLPTVEGVLYSYEDSNEILPHGALIDRYAMVIENCEDGYHKAFNYNFRFCLGKGKWLASSKKLCFKKCPPLISNGLNIKCSYNNNYTDCSNPSIPGTIATTSCKSTYVPSNGQKNTPLELHCQSNGTWNNKLQRCVKYCGFNYNDISSSDLHSSDLYSSDISDDIVKSMRDSTTTEVLLNQPWNVAIYRSKNNTSDLICGGSIISQNLVVSAAHCFWSSGMPKNISINDGLYKVGVGKIYRDITIIDFEYTKIIDVKMIYVKQRYYGNDGLFAEDIAVVLLQNKINFNYNILPVCIDWEGDYIMVNGTEGEIGGWGKTETGALSSELLYVALPYIDHDSCRELFKNTSFLSYLTADKFCAGSESGQGVSFGDSGAGLSFLRSNFYYLTGIVSIMDHTTNNTIAAFTDVKSHIKWIRDLYNQHS